MTILLALKLLFTLPFMLFLPGFLLARAVHPKLTLPEVIALSPALSLAATALVLLGIEKTAERFTAGNVIIAILGLNLLCLFSWVLRMWWSARHQTTK